MKKILKKKGFTLIELIVVITILGILVAIAVPSILNYIGEANTAVEEANLRTAKSQVGLAIALTPALDATGTTTTNVDGVTYTCTWTAYDEDVAGSGFPTAFGCTHP